MNPQGPKHLNKKTIRRVTSTSEMHETVISETNANPRRPAPRSAPASRTPSSRIPMTGKPPSRMSTAGNISARSSRMPTEIPMAGRSSSRIPSSVGVSLPRALAGAPTMRIPTEPTLRPRNAPPATTSIVSKTTIIQSDSSKITKYKPSGAPPRGIQIFVYILFHLSVLISSM